MVIYRRYFDEESWEFIPTSKAINKLEGSLYKKGSLSKMFSGAEEPIYIRSPHAHYIAFPDGTPQDQITSSLSKYE